MIFSLLSCWKAARLMIALCCLCMCVCVRVRACVHMSVSVCSSLCIFLTSLELGVWNLVQVWVINMNPDSLRNIRPWKLKSLYYFNTLHISNKQNAAHLPLWCSSLSNFRNQNREIQNSVNNYLICIHKKCYLEICCIMDYTTHCMYQDTCITVSSISHKSNCHVIGQMEYKLFMCAWFILPRILFL
jgi:hypothetical protein